MSEFPVIHFFWIIMFSQMHYLTTSTRLPNNATRVLKNLLDPNFYDRRLRPNFEGKPVDVSITVFMTSIGGLDEKDMQFKTTFFFRQSWRDSRLAFKDDYPTVDNMTISGDIMKQIWKPDTYINNEKTSWSPENQFLLKISNNGDVLYSQRMTVIASCKMDLKNYPMDKQTCSLMFESYGMTTRDLVLHWATKPFKESIKITDSISMSQFALEGYTATRTVANYTSGSFAVLDLNFHIRRKKFYYVIQTYIPTILITILSWVSFWIPRSSPPARVALGITTVLALTTLIFGIQSSMPKVSYVKAIDWFLMVSFTYVFAALIEYPSSTFIKFQAKKIGKSGKTIIRRVKGEPNHVSSSDLPMSNYAASNHRQDKESSRAEKGYPRVEPFSGAVNGIHREQDFRINGEIRQRLTKEKEEKNKQKRTLDNFTEGEGNVVDNYAKVFFPLTYFLYNVGYWTVYLLEIELLS